MIEKYLKDEVYAKSLEYFNGDELATSTFVNKYALKQATDDEVVFWEATPEDMHNRLANAFSRIENKYSNPRSLNDFKEGLDHFKYIVPGGSVMYGVGNPYVNVSLSNCIALAGPFDSMSGIIDKSKDMANLFKARAGVGIPLDTLRPDGSLVNNSAGSSTGAWSFANYYSEVCRMVGQCLHKDTLILTKRGLVKIKDINIGDKVWAQNGWVNVINTIKNKKPLVKITTKFGKEILCSEDHVFHTIDGEKKTKNFSIEDPITQIVGEGWKGQDVLLENFEYQKLGRSHSSRLNTDINLPMVIDNKLAYLLGQIYGDGSVEKDEISISSGNDWQEIINKIALYIKDVFDYNANITPGDGDLSKIRIHSKLIIHHLQKNKLLKNNSIEMKFPEKLLLSKPNVVFAFLSGYFDADGCVLKGKKAYKLDSVNKDFLIVVQNILSSFGIVSKLHIQDREQLGWLDLYTLTINGEKSQRLFTQYMKESIKIQSIKEEFGNFSKIRDFIKTAYQINDFNSKTSAHSYIGGGEKQKYISYSTSYRLLDDLKLDKKITLLQDSIKSIEDLEYEDETYDLVLDKEHLFFANGLYAHNSGRRGALILTMSVKHPDIEKFITMKNDLTKVTGANISVMVTDDFMNAVKDDADWTLQWPIDVPLEEARYTQVIKAKDLWFKINESATKVAEPGLIFIDNYKKNLPADKYPDFKSVCVNPCCFDQEKDVWVLTKNGIKEIKNITKKDKIWIDEEQKWAKTSGYFDAGMAEVFEVKFSDGETLNITGNHKLEKLSYQRDGTVKRPTKRSLVELKDLSIGDLISKSINSVPENSFGKLGNYNEGTILGWLTGDGCLCYRTAHEIFPTTYLSFWSHEYDVANKMLDIVTQEFDLPLGIVEYNDNNGNIVKRIVSNNITKILTEKYGYNLWKFKNGFNPFLFNASKQFLQGYLKSYFSADGTVGHSEQNSNYNIQLSSIDKDRLYQIKNILTMFGIISSIGVQSEEKEKTIRGKSYNCKKVYRLTICGNKNLELFNKEIGFISDAKQTKLEHILSVINHKKLTKFSTYAKIKSIKSLGLKPIGCIEVDQYHKFTANGFISGNSEILLSEFDSCRLTSINLKGFVINPFKENSYFDFDNFSQKVRLAMRMLDNIIDLEIECLTKMISKLDDESEIILWNKLKKAAEDGRRTGLGTHGLADALACLGIKYDTEEAQILADKIYSEFRNNAYDESVNLAIERGPFSCFDWNTEKDCDFIQRLPQDLQNRIKKHGRRNISLLTNAPTGSISIISQTSSGIEPVFMNFYTRRKKISSDIERVDFVDESGDKWGEYPVFHHNVMEYLKTNDLLEKWQEIQDNTKSSEWANEITKIIPDYFITAMEIDPYERVKIQGTIQQYIDHGISSCLTEESLIQTTGGLLTMKEIAGDTPVKEFKNINCNLQSINSDGNKSTLSQTYNNGYDDVLYIQTQKDFNVKCTKNHKLLTLDKEYNQVWKYAYDIEEGDILIGRIGLKLFPERRLDLETLVGNKFEYKKLTNSKNIKIPTEMTRDLARLIGYLCSDGSVGKNGISLSQNKNNVCDDFISIVSNLFGVSCNIQEDNRSENLVSVVANSREIREFFLWLGLKNHNEVDVPLVIRKSPQHIVREFIKGTTLDGYVSKDKLGIFTSVSYNYAKQVQMLLLNLGIDSGIVRSNKSCYRIFPNSSREYLTQDAYLLYVSMQESEKFIREIGFAENRKVEECYTKLNRSSRIKVKGEIPDFGLRLKFRKEILSNIKSNRLYEMFHSLTCKDKRDRVLSRESLQEMADMGLLVPDFLLDKTYIFRKVEKVELLNEKQQTFDIFVPEGNSYLSNGIINHNTINLSKGTTIEQVQNIYEASWEHKLKGVTVYVDGSRSGVLVSSEDTKKDMNPLKRPKELPCEIHHSTIDGKKWTIFVGLLNNKPYEIFGGLAEYVTIPKKYKFGKITKTKNGHKNVNGRYAFYNLVIDDEDGDPLEVQNIAVTFNNGNYAAQTRMISLALRNGVPVQHIAEQLSRDENSDFFSFSKVMSRVLKKYIEDGAESSENCDLCGAKLRFEGGCSICPACSYSPKCG